MKGREDLRQLAGRLSVLFPSLLSEENLRRISFLSSSKHRCVSSVEAFQEGLQRRWGRSGSVLFQRHHGKCRKAPRELVVWRLSLLQRSSTATRWTTSSWDSSSVAAVTWRAWRRTARRCRRWRSSNTARRWREWGGGRPRDWAFLTTASHRVRLTHTQDLLCTVRTWIWTSRPHSADVSSQCWRVLTVQTCPCSVSVSSQCRHLRFCRKSSMSEVCPSVPPVDLVEAAFFLCSYELSIKSLHSPWCFLFDESDAKVQTHNNKTQILHKNMNKIIWWRKEVWADVCVFLFYLLFVSAGVGVQVGPEAVLEALTRSCDQQPVQLSSFPSCLQDTRQSRTPTQVGDVVVKWYCFLSISAVFILFKSDSQAWSTAEQIPSLVNKLNFCQLSLYFLLHLVLIEA